MQLRQADNTMLQQENKELRVGVYVHLQVQDKEKQILPCLSARVTRANTAFTHAHT